MIRQKKFRFILCPARRRIYAESRRRADFFTQKLISTITRHAAKAEGDERRRGSVCKCLV